MREVSDLYKRIYITFEQHSTHTGTHKVTERERGKGREGKEEMRGKSMCLSFS